MTDHWPKIEEYASPAPVPYPEALAIMDERAAAIRTGQASPLLWLLEHPPLYTAGTSSLPEELLDSAILPVYPSGRGGHYTYHGPGQRIAYVLLDLQQRGADLRAYVEDLQSWLLAVLARLGIQAVTRAGRVGLWVPRADGRDDKIVAIGVRVRRWVTLHGIALNVDPDLSHYAGIVPCGIREHGVTSLTRLGVEIDPAALDALLIENFSAVFRMHVHPATQPL